MITVKCINDKSPWPEEDLPLFKGLFYDVDHIDMGQSFTWVYLKNIPKPFNSLCFEFYEDDIPLDIFKDKRFNPYLKW